MVRLAKASAYILGFAAVSISAFHLPATTPLAAHTTDSTLRMSTTAAPADTEAFHPPNGGPPNGGAYPPPPSSADPIHSAFLPPMPPPPSPSNSGAFHPPNGGPPNGCLALPREVYITGRVSPYPPPFFMRPGPPPPYNYPRAPPSNPTIRVG